jgi:hypothetical protein
VTFVNPRSGRPATALGATVAPVVDVGPWLFAGLDDAVGLGAGWQAEIAKTAAAATVTSRPPIEARVPS